MSRAFCRSRRTRPLIPLVLALASIHAAAPARAATHQKQVLAVYSARPDADIARIGDRELPRILEQNLQETVDYYSEFLDVARFQDLEYEAAFRDFLLRKYKGQRFDLIIAMSPAVADFFGAHRSELFPQAPIVFFETAPVFTRPPNSTGIIAEPSFSGTIDLARTLQPDLQHVFVVTGREQEKESIATERMVRGQLRTMEPQLTVTYLSGLATSDLEARLAALPRHSIVLYVSVNRDATGEFFNPLQYTN